jgi:hypothetical protein
MNKVVYWWWRFLVFVIMLIFPPSLYELVTPSLSSMPLTINNSQLLYLPVIGKLILLIIWVVDYIGMVLLVLDWWMHKP